MRWPGQVDGGWPGGGSGAALLLLVAPLALVGLDDAGRSMVAFFVVRLVLLPAFVGGLI